MSEDVKFVHFQMLVTPHGQRIRCALDSDGRLWEQVADEVEHGNNDKWVQINPPKVTS